MRISGPWLLLLLMASLVCASPKASAQDAEVLPPTESSAKAKQILQETVQALGGAAYLGVHDAECTGRLGQFGHSGDLVGYDLFFDFSKPPDKDRTEHNKKRNIIEVFSGDKGWILDRGGVQDAPEDAVAQFQEDLKKDIDYILRDRLSEKGMTFRYAGPDIVDLKEADWVELTDADGRTIRIAVDQATHLPIRKIVVMRDPKTRVQSEEVEYYSNYHSIQGIQTPFQITRERNTIKVYQVFFEGCRYNTGMSDALFTKQSLEERWAQVGKKKAKKNKQEASGS